MDDLIRWLLTWLIVYCVWYLRQAQKPEVIHSGNPSDPIRKLLIDEMKLNQKRFWPFFLMPTAYCQAFISGCFKFIHSIRIPVDGVRTQKVCTERGDLYLHWYPEPPQRKSPIVVYFHTIVGNGLDSRSRAVFNFLTSKGYQLVAYSRRGHHRPSTWFSPIGDPFMTDQALRAVHIKEKRKLLILGDSAGGSPCMRLMGDLALSGRNPYQVIGTVIISAGFTFDPIPPFGFWATNTLLLPKLRCYWTNNFNRKILPEEAAILEQSPDVKTWTRQVIPFSGYSSWDEFYEAADAAVTYEALKSREGLKFTPNVLINARDDMFFPGGLVDKYRDIFTSVRNWALVIPKRGGHLGFRDFFCQDWALNLATRVFDGLVELSAEREQIAG